jgi:hypothetical protein
MNTPHQHFTLLSLSATGIRFKPSPFLRVEQLVSTVVECPGEILSLLMTPQHPEVEKNQLGRLIEGLNRYRSRLVRSRLASSVVAGLCD